MKEGEGVKQKTMFITQTQTAAWRQPGGKECRGAGDGGGGRWAKWGKTGTETLLGLMGI